MINIDKLLKKKGWTGEELGKLELVNMLDVFRQSLEGIDNPKPIISRSDMQKMLNTLTDPVEIRIYNSYISIHEWFSRSYSGAVAQQQQAMLNYRTLLFIITNATTAEEIYSYIAELPAVMTEKQYKDAVAQCTEAVIQSEGRKNIFELLDDAIQYSMGKLEASPKAKNPLKPLKEKLEKEPVTDPHILDNYNHIWGCGYYTLEDGTRSDEVTEEEWHKLISPVITEVLDATDSPFSSLEEEIRVRSTRDSLLDRTVPIYLTAIYEGATDEEADHLQHEADIKAGLVKRCEWHYYDTPPEDLNKWEVLEDGELFEYYPSLRGEGVTGKEAREEVKAFIKEFPEVVTAMLKDMERYIKGISSVPVEKWLTTSYSYGELYNMDYYGFKSEIVEDNSYIFSDNRRAVFNGVAILQPDPFNAKRTVEPATGYYKAPAIPRALNSISLDCFFTDSEDYAENVETVEDAREVLEDSYYYLKGYNLALDLIAQRYGLEEIAVGKMELDRIDEDIKTFNGLVLSLYSHIKHTYYDYDNEDLKQKKLGVLKDVLYPIDTDAITIPEKAVEKAKADLKDFKAFKEEMSDLILTLCYKEEEGV